VTKLLAIITSIIVSIVILAYVYNAILEVAETLQLEELKSTLYLFPLAIIAGMFLVIVILILKGKS